MHTPVDNRRFYGTSNAAILFFVHMATIGLVVYAYSVIFPAMVEHFDWSRGKASIAKSLNLLVLGFMAPLVMLVLKKIGGQKTIMLGLSVLIVGMTLLGTVTEDIWLWTILWGLVVPVGVALAGQIPIQFTIMNWFSLKRATVIGLVVTAGPLGGFFVQPSYTWLIEYTGTWRAGWLITASFLALVLVLTFRLKNKPADVGQYQDGVNPADAEPTEAVRKKTTGTYRTTTTWTNAEAFKTRTLRFMLVMFITKIMAFMMIFSHGVLHMTDKGYSGMEAAYVLMAILIASASARFPIGWLGDRIEPRFIISIAIALMLLGFVLVWQAPSFLLLVVGGALFGAAHGSTLVMDTTMLGNYFSPESYPSIMSVVLPALTVSVALVPVFAGFIADNTGSYELAFSIWTIGLGISFIFSCFLKPPQKSAVLAD